MCVGVSICRIEEVYIFPATLIAINGMGEHFPKSKSTVGHSFRLSFLGCDETSKCQFGICQGCMEGHQL